MKTSTYVFVCLALALDITNVVAQGLNNRFYFGLGGGTQALVTTDRKAKSGVGVEGSFGYRFSNHFSASLVGGYSVMPFNFRGAPVANGPRTQTLEPNIIYGNLLFDYNLIGQGTFQPFVMMGVGGLNFKGFRLTNNNQVRQTNRRNTVSGIAGGGVRYFVSPSVAVNLNGSYHLTGTDAIDTGRGKNDAYVSARLGMTFYPGTGSGPSDDLFTNMAEVEQDASNAIDGLLVEEQETDDSYKFSSTLNEPDENNTSGDYLQEYAKLQSQVDGLSQEIDEKENAISGLRDEITSKVNESQRLATMTKYQPPDRSGGQVSFARLYEQALDSFYNKRFGEAINKFEMLVAQFPTHALASNCHYWMGEARYGLGDFQSALTSFEMVLNFQKSLKKDDALLMLGKTFLALNRRDDARQSLSRLIREFPESEFVVKAEEFLNKM